MRQKRTPTVFALYTRIVSLFQQKIRSARCGVVWFFFPRDNSLLNVAILGAYEDG